MSSICVFNLHDFSTLVVEKLLLGWFVVERNRD